MIKWAIMGVGVIAGTSFAAGLYVGWKTTLRIVHSVNSKKEKTNGH